MNAAQQSFYDEIAAAVATVKAKMPKRPAPAPCAEPPFDVEAARAELATLRLDANYERSDDFTAYCRGRDAAARHAYLTRRIAEASS